jgi:peptidoglycan/LPS O-acetylase OafA/YrhL
MKDQRILGLDFARTLAILSVVAAHTTSFQIGVFGVQLFFIISGYLLADFHNQYTSFNFLLHRFLRLAPLAWLSILIFQFRFTSSTELALNLLLLNALFLNVSSFPGGWSISFEWLFSIFNLFLIRCKNLVVYGILLFTWFFQVIIYYFEKNLNDFNANLLPMATLFANCSFFVCGNLIRRLSISISSKYLVIAIIFLCPLIDFAPPYMLIPFNLVLVIIFLLCLNLRLKTKFVLTLFHFIGKRTYGIFLGHFVVLIGIENVAQTQELSDGLGSFWPFIQFLIVALGGTLIGALTFRFLEKPMMVYSSKVLRKTL